MALEDSQKRLWSRIFSRLIKRSFKLETFTSSIHSTNTPIVYLDNSAAKLLEHSVMDAEPEKVNSNLI